MNATDELRRMLDERGEQYIDGGSDVTWRYYSDPHTATESIEGTLIVTGLTPEQAIDATLRGMKLYAVNTWSDLDDWGESYIERRLYRSKEDAERRAEEVEALSSDDFQYGAMVVEFEVVE